MPPAWLCLVLSLGRPNKEMNRSVLAPGFSFQGNCTLRVELVGRPVISNVLGLTAAYSDRPRSMDNEKRCGRGMKAQHLTALIVWLVVIGGVLWQVLLAPPDDLLNAFRLNGFTICAATCLPLLIVPTAIYFQSQHPFESERLRERINGRFGEGTFESYTRMIRPLLLLGAGSSLMGIGFIARALLGQAQKGAFVAGAFFLSFGLGTLAARIILRHKGNTIE